MLRMDGGTPGQYEPAEIRNAKMAWGFLQILDPELYVHSPTIPDCHTGIDYLRTIVKQIGDEYVSHCKRACVEFMQIAWKSEKSSDSRLVGFPDVIKAIKNIGGACERLKRILGGKQSTIFPQDYSRQVRKILRVVGLKPTEEALSC
jgi:hypothetical protein